MRLLREYIRSLLEQESTTIKVPASVLSSVAGEYRVEPHWKNFRKLSKEEQVAWAKEHFGDGIREPIDVRIFASGLYGFGDGHHRVRAAQILDEMIPIRIGRNQLLEKSPELWEYWHGLVMQGLHPKWDLNREGWVIKTLEQAQEVTGR